MHELCVWPINWHTWLNSQDGDTSYSCATQPGFEMSSASWIPVLCESMTVRGAAFNLLALEV